MLRTLASFLLALAFGASAAAPAVDGNAVGPVRIGMPASVIAKVVQVTSDRLESDSEGGQVRMIRMVIAGTEAAAEVHEGRIWRIEVAVPGTRTLGGIGVSTPLATLLKLPQLQGEIGEGALYVWSPQLCGLSFRLSHELQTDRDFTTQWNGRSLASLPPTVTVRSLLVTGCAK